MGDTVRDSLERITRFLKHVRYHEPLKTGLLSVLAVVMASACILYPVYSFVVSTAGLLGIYSFLGEKRPTFLLGYISLILLPFFLLYGFSRRTFVWQERRYKYNNKFDIEISDD